MSNMEDPKVMLESASFEFSQKGNCVDEAEHEVLTIECKSDLGIDYNGGCFYVLKTEQWSINDIEELRALIDRISKTIENK